VLQRWDDPTWEDAQMRTHKHHALMTRKMRNDTDKACQKQRKRRQRSATMWGLKEKGNSTSQHDTQGYEKRKSITSTLLTQAKPQVLRHHTHHHTRQDTRNHRRYERSSDDHFPLRTFHHQRLYLRQRRRKRRYARCK
jgi:hypothetical protein